MKRRDWRNNWRDTALRATSAVIKLCIFCILLTGCATRTEVALRERAQRAEARAAELEQIVAGKDDDNAMLMRVITEQNGYIRELGMGAAMQADYISRIRRNCDL